MAGSSSSTGCSGRRVSPPSTTRSTPAARLTAPSGVDFAKHAEAMGAIGIRVQSIGDLEEAVRTAKAADRTTVIHIDAPDRLDRQRQFPVECGTPEVSERPAVQEARKAHPTAGKKKQRVESEGWPSASASSPYRLEQ
ncbi:MAG: thiamine pyrophosphate-dependent enzyme [Geminicoccaceae bacterium]